MLVIRAIAPMPAHEWSYIVPVPVPRARPARAPAIVLAVLATAVVLLGALLVRG